MRKKRFTLLEILVVIAIIAILISLLLPIKNNVLHKAKVIEAKTEMKRIQAAINDYYNVYNKYPLDSSRNVINIGLENTPLRPNNLLTLIKTLNNTISNPRGIIFYDKKLATNESPFLDPWGEYYKIFLDANRDQTVDLPYEVLFPDGTTLEILAEDGSRLSIKSRVAIISTGFENTININSWTK